MDRRTYLGAVGVAAVALAGCAGGDEAASDGPGTASPDADTGTDRSGTADVTDGATPATSSSVTPTPIFPGYETTTVVARSPDGDRLGAVTAAIADTPDLRYTGLSDTRSLPADRGMLFVYESVADRTFVMRRMAFGIDIVYADADGTITRVHHAPAPGPDEDGSDQRYPGRGQYVLELVYDWTTDHGVSTGDVLSFALDG